MELRLTKEEAGERLKSKITTWIGVVLIFAGIAMLGCRIAYIWTKNDAMKFSWGTEIAPVIGLGWTFFAAKESIIQGMIGLLLPRKK